MAQMPYFLISGHASLVDDPLDRDRGSLTAADAERGDAAFQVVRLQRMQQRHDKPCAGGADGVAERAGAAVDIQLLTRDAEIASAGVLP